MRSLFYMWSQRRENLIAQHKFYVEEGKRRITDQFRERKILEEEALEYAEKWLKKVYMNMGESNVDVEGLEEVAHEKCVDFYMALEQMGNYARLGLVTGMYHLWERSLKEWLTSNDGIMDWYRGEELPKQIWGANFNQIFEIFDYAGVFVNDSIKDRMNCIRLVVNTYKHGQGGSFDELKSKRRDLFDDYSVSFDDKMGGEMKYVFHDDLYIKDHHIDEFSDTIVDFWRGVPEHIWESDSKDLPKWFENAIKRDSNKL